jgi:hypothetical protein
MQRKSTLSTIVSQSRKHRLSRQNEDLLALLRAYGHSWVPLPEIIRLGIARYGARVLELRRMGFKIENRTEFKDGVCRSWYRLVEGPASDREEPKKDLGWHGWSRPTGLPLFDAEKR